MSSYGVPADLDGVLPWSWAEERLVANKNYWVVTADGAGRPHAMPVWGVWLPDPDRFVFSCAPTARKARNIAVNPHVCVTVDDTVECVSVEGTARVVESDAADAEPTGRIYAEKYEPDAAKRADLAAFFLSHHLVEVTPERAFGIIERDEDFARRATRWVWDA
jgi:nitroimidazol reductase NimA-like FMN-containing flavoprotein (pyridoxamine 5'-phosphate oxidase superfamily)